MAALFPPDAVIRRIDSEPLLLLGGGRALLMQLAHPAVAAAVADHSSFRADPWLRLRQTVAVMSVIVFGTEEQAAAAADSVRAVHERVIGSSYRASDPALMLWVHATLVDTALRVHSRFLGPLAPGEAEQYYEESMAIAEVLGVARDEQPPDLVAFSRYVSEVVATVEVGDTARALAHDVLHPRSGPAAGLGLAVHRRLTAGLLPARLRRQYGLEWDWPGHFGLQMATAASRLVLPRVPAPVRRAPAHLL